MSCCISANTTATRRNAIFYGLTMTKWFCRTNIYRSAQLYIRSPRISIANRESSCLRAVAFCNTSAGIIWWHSRNLIMPSRIYKMKLFILPFKVSPISLNQKCKVSYRLLSCKLNSEVGSCNKLQYRRKYLFRLHIWSAFVFYDLTGLLCIYDSNDCALAISSALERRDTTWDTPFTMTIEIIDSPI